MNRKITTRIAATIAAVAVGVALAGCSASSPKDDNDSNTADDAGWTPAKGIDLYVGYDPGGSGDSIARELALVMQDDWGVAINVQNRAGASGAEATTELLQQDADGYAIGVAPASQLSVTPLLSSDALTFKDADDWTTLGGLLDQQNGILVRPESGWKDIKDFIDAAKKAPGELTVGVPSAAGANAMAVASLMDVAGIEVKIVPFSGGSGESSVALLGGQIDAICATLSGQLGLLQAGQLISLGHSGDQPYESADSETLESQGYPITSLANSVYYVYGPKDMPKDVVDSYKEMLERIQDGDTFSDWLKTASYNPHRVYGDEAKQELLDASKDAQDGIDLLTAAGLELTKK